MSYFIENFSTQRTKKRYFESGISDSRQQEVKFLEGKNIQFPLMIGWEFLFYVNRVSVYLVCTRSFGSGCFFPLLIYFLNSAAYWKRFLLDENFVGKLISETIENRAKIEITLFRFSRARIKNFAFFFVFCFEKYQSRPRYLSSLNILEKFYHSP